MDVGARAVDQARRCAGAAGEARAQVQDGRKPGTISPVRKAVRRYLANHPADSAAQAWKAFTMKLLRGIELYEANGAVERYIRTAGWPDTSYRQFQNIVSEERPKSR